ncbi:hypothetical protein ACFYNO_32770 [Kitasatospora sp. NPDC006697]|uniref:hypothetical protein n=1 Tax=Kitasatospora sp. NPDC006697 TaxID=3364020 RepID=UPI0036C96F15
MMGTSRQVELLRDEVGRILQNGLQEVRADTTALRTELTTTLIDGLREVRSELQKALAREQRALSETLAENRDLRRELDQARVGLTAADASAAPDPLPVPERVLSEAPEQQDLAEPPAGAAGDGRVPVAEQPHPQPPVRAADGPAPAEPAPVPVPEPVHIAAMEETTVSDASEPARSDDESVGRIPEDVAAAELAAAMNLTFPDTAPDSGPQPAPAALEAATAAHARPDGARVKAEVHGDLFHLLTSAACIGTAELVCHPHVWQFIGAGATAASPHFQLSASISVDKDDDLVTVLLPGPSLMAVIKSLYDTYFSSGLTGSVAIEDRALALAYYTAIAHEVRKTDPAFAVFEAENAGRPRTRIIIDQRPKSKP